MRFGTLTEASKDDKWKSIADDELATSQLSLKSLAELHTSPKDPRIISSPPKKKYVPMPAEPTPGPPVPLQPKRSQVRGVRLSKKPMSALCNVNECPLHRTGAFAINTGLTASGVGFPNVFRKSPLTWLGGDR
jgi:hypothetical protein